MDNQPSFYVMPVTGTDIWYYFICNRECWLMIHEIASDQEDENVEIGRFLHEYWHSRQKKEVAVDSIKMDRIKRVNGELIVTEMKKSSKFKESARHQLLYYLQNLKKMGIEAKGELSFPEEKRKEKIILTPEAEDRLDHAVEEIRKIARLPIPPKAKKIKFCGKCAYKEFCWAEGE